MFTFDPAIDMIQTGKKQFVKTFVTNAAVADAMIAFVDAQAEYTKKAIKATTDAATEIMQETQKAMREAAKFDYSKFGEGIMKAYTATSKK
jgi:hypothetical protein